MSTQHKDFYKNAVIENAKWINYVLVTGLVLAGTLILLKLTGTSQFEWNKVNIRTSDSWIVFVLLSLAHYYTSWLFAQSSYKLWKQKDSLDARLSCFQEIITTGGLFFRGLIPRTKIIQGRAGKEVYEIKIYDPSLWVSYGGAIALVAAITPFEFNDVVRFVALLVFSTILVLFNWKIGSNWAITLSELGIPHNQSAYFFRVRPFVNPIRVLVAMLFQPTTKVIRRRPYYPRRDPKFLQSASNENLLKDLLEDENGNRRRNQ